jgi:8-oxo-dGTP diphosphatase
MTERRPDETSARPVLIIDGANVVGSRADGWWRDRAGAAERLRDRLALLDGLDGLPGEGAGTVHPEIILVTEGAARGVPGVPGVRVVEAPGSGDDTIAELAATEAGERRVVVTADRGLRRRAEAAGASVVGPGWLLARLR